MSEPTDDNKQPPKQLQDLQKQAPLALHEAVQAERTELMQIHGMLRCLTDVLLYADDDDSVMHSDVACVCARLLNECVTRLDAAVMRHLQGLAAPAGPSESPATDKPCANSGEKS